MTSDLKNLKRFRVTFRKGQPFLPFQQLLACLPAASANFLPAPYRRLMTSESSPLVAYYPPVDQIKVDMNGKVSLRSLACNDGDRARGVERIAGTLSPVLTIFSPLPSFPPPRSLPPPPSPACSATLGRA